MELKAVPTASPTAVQSSGQSPFEHKEYDVTNWICNCGCASARLILEPEEAVLRQACIPCVNTNKRMPYGELGSVDITNSCGCCWSFSSNLTPGQGDNPGGLAPGFGCDQALVEEIVAELKARMKVRGDTGNIQRAEQQLAIAAETRQEIATLSAKVDAILAHLNISPPPAPAAQAIDRGDAGESAL